MPEKHTVKFIKEEKKKKKAKKCVLLSHGWDVQLLQEQEVSFFSILTTPCTTLMTVSSYKVSVGHQAAVGSNQSTDCDIVSLTPIFFNVGNSL